MADRKSIVAIAKRMGLTDEKGDLRQLDSLQLIDFVVELEKVLGVSIPSAALQTENFASFDTLDAMLKELH